MAIASNFPAIKPSLSLDFANTKRLDSRVTFTRTTTATYYDGVTTAKAEQNLLRNSQVFSYDVSSWNSSFGSAITSSTEIAPDGTATATKFIANNGATSAFIGTSNTGVTLTNYGATINLSTGATATAFGTLNGSITATEFPTGSGWYRIVVTQDGYTFSFYAKAAEYTFAGLQISNVFRMHACNQSGSVTLSPAGDGTKGILIWGAQMEYRSSVTAYTATTTQPITNYIPVLLTAASGVARFQHNPTTDESLGLLIEEARTNLLTYSADFSNAAWTKTRSSITSNTIVAPDGMLTGDKLVEDTTASNTHQVSQTISKAASAITYTGSVYIKAAERTFASIAFSDAGGFIVWGVNLTTGAAQNNGFTGWTAASIATTNVGNGWWRVQFTGTSTANTNASVVIRAATGIATDSYTGDGYSGIFLWGAQLEAGAFATSYIATTAATVTRNADAANMTGSNFTSWFNAAEGTVYFESQSAQGANAYSYSLFGSSSSNRIFTNYSSNSKMDSGIRVNGTFDVLMPTPNNSAPLNTFGKGALAYKVNDFGFSWNGAAALTDTSTTLPIIQELDIGTNGNLTSGLAGNYLNGTIKKLAYYPLRLTNANLQALTS